MCVGACFQVAEARSLVAEVLLRAGQGVYAELLCRKALATDQYIFGAGHPRVAWHLARLARILAATGRVECSIQLLGQVGGFTGGVPYVWGGW